MYGNLYIIYVNYFSFFEKIHLLFLIKILGIYDCCVHDFLGEENKKC